MYADGIVRDEYNIAIDGIRLRQNLLIIVIYMGLFLALRRVLKSRCIMTIILVAFIPVSFYSFTTISTNTVAIKKIVDDKEYKKTGIEKIHLADLKNILAKKKSATIYVGREDCPASVSYTHLSAVSDCSGSSRCTGAVAEIFME